MKFDVLVLMVNTKVKKKKNIVEQLLLFFSLFFLRISYNLWLL